MFQFLFFLQINGKDISWKHLVRAYEANRGRTTESAGLWLLNKVKFQHVFLTPYSRMRVDLAAQVKHTHTHTCTLHTISCPLISDFLKVLSSSVAHCMEHMGDSDMEETIRFVRFFDRFFDCLNVSNLTKGRKSLKKDLYPYRTPDDDRFDVS